ncbi:MAG: hypothetical protein E7470_07250 [Ruminococcaceae bacterium]|nr:hypothetical protein [Oscillospiraceae bacterium]
MRYWKKAVLFYLGGMAYMLLEFAWRGRSDGSMFLLGGACFLLVGGKVAAWVRLPLALRLLAGAAVITALELLTGLLVNRSYAVWDYRQMPFQFMGQICLSYSLLWIPVSFGAMLLHDRVSRLLDSRK